MVALLLSLAIGFLGGLRTMSAPTAVSWAAWLGFLRLDGTWLSFLGHPVTPWLLTALAFVELVTDQLPSTPSRKVPVQFGARIVSGGFSGLAIGAASGVMVLGAVAGVAGAVLGTLGGSEARTWRVARATSGS